MRALLIPVLMLAAAFAAAQEMPRILSFTVAPQKIAPGQAVTVAWKATGVQSVLIDWAPAKNSRGQWQRRAGLPPEGSFTMTPTESTVYVLSCETGAGPVCASASVTVEMKPRS